MGFGSFRRKPLKRYRMSITPLNYHGPIDKLFKSFMKCDEDGMPNHQLDMYNGSLNYERYMFHDYPSHLIGKIHRFDKKR